MQSTLILIQVPVGACQRTHTFHHPLNPSPTTKHAAQYRLSGAKVKEMLICCQAGSLCRGKLWRICAAWRKWGEGGRDWETERQEVNVLPGSTLITKQQRKDQQEAREESENANDESDRVFGLAGLNHVRSMMLSQAFILEEEMILCCYLDQLQNMKPKIRQRTWMGRVKVTSSDLCVAVGLFFGSKNMNRKNKHPDDEEK